MVTRTNGYLGTPFRVQSGVTQGGALSPTVFNLVIDGVLRHLVSVVSVM